MDSRSVRQRHRDFGQPLTAAGGTAARGAPCTLRSQPAVPQQRHRRAPTSRGRGPGHSRTSIGGIPPGRLFHRLKTRNPFTRAGVCTTPRIADCGQPTARPHAPEARRSAACPAHMRGGCSAVLRRGEHSEVAPSGGVVGRRRSRQRCRHRLRQRLEVVRGGDGLFRVRVHVHDSPATWHRQPIHVLRTQVISVRLDVGRQRPEHSRRLSVGVGEGRDRRRRAGRAGTAPGCHER